VDSAASGVDRRLHNVGPWTSSKTALVIFVIFVIFVIGHSLGARCVAKRA
jgi:hypothetical protein